MSNRADLFGTTGGPGAPSQGGGGGRGGPNMQNIRPRGESIGRVYAGIPEVRYVTVKEAVRTDNLVDLMNMLHDDEKEIIVEAVTKHGARSVHLGMIPFLNREYVIKCLDELASTMCGYVPDYSPQLPKATPYMVRHKLDVNVWLEITNIGDPRKHELNTITGEIREVIG